MEDSERVEFLAGHTADVCASFQEAVVDILVDAVGRAVRETRIHHVAVVGGVSANSRLRSAIRALGEKQHFSTYIPPLKYCMDNAAMIGIAGLFKLRSGNSSPLSLTVKPNLSV
jgi:N6-L-threonylcarbamoyladenine synthase